MLQDQMWGKVEQYCGTIASIAFDLSLWYVSGSTPGVLVLLCRAGG
jgi:hypothetical protein